MQSLPSPGPEAGKGIPQPSASPFKKRVSPTANDQVVEKKIVAELKDTIRKDKKAL